MTELLITEPLQLNNIGQSCYLNSALQCIFNDLTLVNFINKSKDLLINMRTIQINHLLDYYIMF